MSKTKRHVGPPRVADPAAKHPGQVQEIKHPTPVTGKARETWVKKRKPITDLKPGDKVKRITGSGGYVFPAEGEVVEVCRVIEPRIDATKGSGTPAFLLTMDFTGLFKDPYTGELMEYAFPSVLFERAE